MVEIVYEHVDGWPEAGPLQVNISEVKVEIPVSPDRARRRANGYVGMHIGLLLGSSNPWLMLASPPIWKLSVNLHLPHVGYVGQVGTICVNAMTGELIPPSTITIQTMQKRARDFALRFASTPAPAG